MTRLRPARADESAALTALCMRSKASWGYDADFMEACRDELTITPEQIANDAICVAETNGTAIGVAQVCLEGERAELDGLFIDPDAQHGGIGKRLFEWAAQAARSAGANCLDITSDPGARDFYLKMGAVECGTVPSGSIPGRFLPLLSFKL